MTGLVANEGFAGRVFAAGFGVGPPGVLVVELPDGIAGYGSSFPSR